MRQIFSAWSNDVRGDFIPGDPSRAAPDHPDAFDIRQAPASIRTPTGPPTANFVSETGTVVIEFNEHHVNPDFIRRSVNRFATENGPASVTAIEVWVSDQVMASEDGVWLVANKYDRVIVANSKSGLHCWRKQVKLRKKKEAA